MARPSVSVGKNISVGKKCIPGLFCIENMTMFLMFVLLITVIYLYYSQIVNASKINNSTAMIQPIVVIPPVSDVSPPGLVALSARNDPMQSEYAPPLKIESYGLPINIKTRGYEGNYSQLGILTRESGENMILPLMGRRSTSGRDKHQYYTMTNTAGNINTKLPVSVKGRSCTSEMGCDEIYNNDAVYVEGYNDTFRATIYENALYSYIPWM
jgi:hypothetical protein